MPFVLPRAAGASDPSWTAYGVTALGVLPLLWRTRAPVAVLTAVVLAGFAYNLGLDGPGQPLPYAALVAFYTVAVRCPGRVRAVVSVCGSVAAVPAVVWNTGTARELFFTLFVLGAAYVFGRLQYTRQAYTAAVEDRAAQLERANRVEAEQAAARERARIAREMHDILSHAVSLMIVQAEAGPVAVRRAPDRAEAAFEAISETGRDAMAQLRTMLGVLRDDGPAPGGGAGTGPADTGAGPADAGAAGAGPGPAAPGRPGSAPRAPQPGVAALPALLDRVRRGGPGVSYERRGTVRPLAATADTTAYRVVQEALTNVVRHARAREVAVVLDYGPDTLTVTVTDDGRGPSAHDGATGGRRGGGGGHGLAGIRERAAAHGGTAEAGPGPDGRGFRVRAVLVTSPLEVGN
ncbi:sensor histidine kinase [Streptomyces sp. NPDC051567]|uniref:sensor histidine kinase n=1 Tax=Streptomyces sp. NPDC051567 TaxID=3365660 RepID=UPI0037977F7E